MSLLGEGGGGGFFVPLECLGLLSAPAMSFLGGDGGGILLPIEILGALRVLARGLLLLLPLLGDGGGFSNMPRRGKPGGATPEASAALVAYRHDTRAQLEIKI